MLAATQAGGMPMSLLFGYIIFFVVLMYFMAIRPQQKEKKKMEELNAREDTINKSQLLFGINQGAILDDVRVDHAKRISELELDGYLVRHGQPALVLGGEDLKHNDILLGHGAVVNEAVFPAQGMALVGKGKIFSCHRYLLNRDFELVTEL